MSRAVQHYLRQALIDAVSALRRTTNDRSALAAILLFLLPWFTLVFIRDDTTWLESFGEIVAVCAVFWWMTRSGARTTAVVTRPRIEAIFAIALVVLWVEWRFGICSNRFVFLPDQFSCYTNLEFEIAPKLLEMVVLPLLVLFFTGYGLRSQGLNWDWRAWWICLPSLIALIVYRVFLHQPDASQLFSKSITFFFAAGLPEEYLFRSFLLTRLEAWWRSAGWALFGSSLIFGLSHLAIDYLVFTKQDLRETWILALTFQMGFGYAFGFAFQRVRNILPLAVFHAFVDAL